jgi:hypothetical protein
MPYTYKAIASVWVFMLVLFALSASNAASGRWLLAIVAAAFLAPLTLGLWPKPHYQAVSDRTAKLPR